MMLATRRVPSSAAALRVAQWGGARWRALPLARLSSSSAGEGTATSPPSGASTAQPDERATLSSANVLFGISDEQIKHVSDAVRRAVSLENASERQRRKVENHRAIQHWQQRPGDTGSPAVQSARARAPGRARAAPARHALTRHAARRRRAPVALLTIRVDYLKAHLEKFHKDKDSKRVLNQLVSKRQRLLTYLLKEDRDMYRRVCLELKVGPWKEMEAEMKARSEGSAWGS